MLDASGRHLTERAADGTPRRRDALDVELDATELELAVVTPQRVGAAGVAVERHPDAAGIQEVRPVRPGPPELEVAVPEDDRPVAHAGQHPLLARLRLPR